jgi:hypothetical protein
MPAPRGESRESRAFAVQGETALAWYFVMAYWPSRATQPVLQIESSPMKVLLDDTREVSEHLRSTIAAAGTRGGLMARSAKALIAELDRRVPSAPAFKASAAGRTG